MNPLIEPTRKKFELSRYLLRKNIAKLKSKEIGNTSIITNDCGGLILDKTRIPFDHKLDHNNPKISVETSITTHKDTNNKNNISILSTASPNTPLVRNSKSILPRPRLESHRGNSITISGKIKSTPLPSNITNRQHETRNVIHLLTCFEKTQHNIDLFDFLSEDCDVAAGDSKGDTKLGIIQNTFYVKTIEDYDYDSDNSDSDESTEDMQEIENKLSKKLSNPEANIGFLYKISSFFSRVSYFALLNTINFECKMFSIIVLLCFCVV